LWSRRGALLWERGLDWTTSAGLWIFSMYFDTIMLWNGFYVTCGR
jgi:hypothetical protein